jgi:hypothetical protein
LGALFHYGYVEANQPKFSARLLFGIHLWFNPNYNIPI